MDMGWIISLLVENWEIQAAYAYETLNFETPEFIELLKRTRNVGLALYKAEPRMAKREKMMRLINIHGGDGMGTALEYGLSHSIPLRASLEQPALMHASVNLLDIHANSQWKAEAIAYIEDRLQREKATIHGDEMYVDFKPGTYEVNSSYAKYMGNAVIQDWGSSSQKAN